MQKNQRRSLAIPVIIPTILCAANILVTSGCNLTCKNGLAEAGEICLGDPVGYQFGTGVDAPSGDTVFRPIIATDITGDGSDDVMAKVTVGFGVTEQTAFWISDDVAAAKEATQAGAASPVVGASTVLPIPQGENDFINENITVCQFDTDAAHEVIVIASIQANADARNRNHAFIIDQNRNGELVYREIDIIDRLTDEEATGTGDLSFCADFDGDGIDEWIHRQDGKIVVDRVVNDLGAYRTDQSLLLLTDNELGLLGRNSFFFSQKAFAHDVDQDGDLDIVLYEIPFTFVLLRNDYQNNAQNNEGTDILASENAFFPISVFATSSVGNQNGDADILDNFSTDLADIDSDGILEMFTTQSAGGSFAQQLVTLRHIDFANIATGSASEPSVIVTYDQESIFAGIAEIATYQHQLPPQKEQTFLYIMSNSYVQQVSVATETDGRKHWQLGNNGPLDESRIETSAIFSAFEHVAGDVNADGLVDILADQFVFLSTP